MEMKRDRRKGLLQHFKEKTPFCFINNMNSMSREFFFKYLSFLKCLSAQISILFKATHFLRSIFTCKGHGLRKKGMSVMGHPFNIQKGIFLFVLAMTSFSEARDLHSLLGVGYKHPYASLELPTGSIRYYTLPHIALDFFMGIDTKEEKDYVGMGSQVNYIFLSEEYVHMYFGVSASYVSFKDAFTLRTTETEDTQEKKKSGFEVTPLVGCELFLPSASSIGFSIEMGLTFTLIDSKSSLQTFARTPLKAGVFFYF